MKRRRNTLILFDDNLNGVEKVTANQVSAKRQEEDKKVGPKGRWEQQSVASSLPTRGYRNTGFPVRGPWTICSEVVVAGVTSSLKAIEGLLTGSRIGMVEELDSSTPHKRFLLEL